MQACYGYSGIGGAGWHESGRFSEAIKDLEKKLASCSSCSEAVPSEYLVTLAELYLLNGMPTKSLRTLERVNSITVPNQLALKSRIIEADALTSTGQYSDAKLIYELLLIDFEKSDDLASAAYILNNLGVLMLRQGKVSMARTYFSRGIIDQPDSQSVLHLKLSVNYLRTLLYEESSKEVDALITKITRLLLGLPQDYNSATLSISLLRHIDSIRFELDSAPSFMKSRYQLAKYISETGTKVENNYLKSFGDTSMAILYYENNRMNEAVTLYERAMFNAQKIQSDELLFMQHWHLGRIFKQLGKVDRSLSNYRTALSHLQQAKQNSPIGTFGTNLSYSIDIIPMLEELASVLLERSRIYKRQDQKQALLQEARDVIEETRASELVNYFEDDCVSSVRKQSKLISEISDKIIVLYPIILEDRLELLVSSRGLLHQFTVNVGKKAVSLKAHSLRNNLQSTNSILYKRYAQDLYQWLIKPIEGLLAQSHPETIVFVPSGELHGIPISVLHDGDQYLVERYAIAITPGISLTESRPLGKGNLEILASGITESVQGYPALNHVRDELSYIHDKHASVTLMDQDFNVNNLHALLDNKPYPVIHIATHGEFLPKTEDSFLLTYDNRIRMNDLGNVLTAGRYTDQPLELIVLSACQTGVGSNSGALGMGGLAIRSGARSAVATLWVINDKASSQLVKSLYDYLDEKTLSRANALRNAQLDMIHNQEFSHPFYWAPFILIGNWL